MGFTRFNIGGKGRILDAGIKIGSSNRISHSTNRFFKYFNISYTDPWIAHQTQYRADLLHYQKKSQYLEHHLRLTNSLQWTLASKTTLQLGHRWEEMTKEETTTKSIGATKNQLTVSVPFIQLTKDTRDSQVDPTNGTYSLIKVELANKLFLNRAESNFFKLYIRHQHLWPLGHKASNGIIACGFHMGMATPASDSIEDIPHSEKFLINQLFGLRGMEPNTFGPHPYRQGEEDANCCNSLIALNIEYQFPLFGKSVWGEIFADSAIIEIDKANKVNSKNNFGTSVGCGLVFKKIGIPIKIEYIIDLNRKARTIATPTRNLLISAGLQF